MTKEEFLALSKPEAIKYAWNMLLDRKVTREQYNRLIKSVNQKQNKLIKDVQEVFNLKEAQ